MFIWLTIVTALRILQRNQLRAGLTLLGIVIGVAAVIAMVSIGEGAKQAVQKQIASIGTNVIMIWPSATRVGGVRGAQGSAVTLTVADAMELKKKVPLLTETGWSMKNVTQIVHGNRNCNSPVYGVSTSYLHIRDWRLSSGGPFTQTDMDSAALVAILGQTVVNEIFEPGEEPLGALIRINNVPLRVIGVLSPKGQSLYGSDQDDVVVIPFSTAERKVLGTMFLGSVGGVYVSTGRVEDLQEATEEIRQVMRARHRIKGEEPDDFTIRTQVEIGMVQEETSETLTVMLMVIACVSLLVGGIGIMNILLVSVTERTREIGIRMAVGAKRVHIMMQFLIEAMTLGVVGGLIGIACGILAARLTTIIAGWPTIISTDAVVVAFIFSVVVGLFFGLYPANKAARLNPIEALRYE
ncbi:MAG: ABC transporter permease [Nitrospira sp.]|nr:ABC transporter permease [Nitrospira sp.]MDR4463947.1 ABC transporter permease [Nitrospira sp.]MDR4469422.1 ABC transporter permease [Nitrospira sp.]